MDKYIISTDSCVDLPKTYLESNGVEYIILKRITDGVTKEEMYDRLSEYEGFYEEIRRGALPTTSQLNHFELHEHFEKILQKNQKGDIIHISLSSGLSETCGNAQSVAAEMNTQLTGRKIYIIDSLSATLGIGMMVDRLIEMRQAEVLAADAVKRIERIRDHQQVWAIVDNLFHLKRGGRISGFKAAVGTFLKIKPILIVNSEGKLVIEKTIKGTQTAIDYIVKKMEELGINSSENFFDNTVYIVHSSSSVCRQLEQTLMDKYGDKIKIKKGMIGPIIGTHVGGGTVGIIYEGARRLTIGT